MVSYYTLLVDVNGANLAFFRAVQDQDLAVVDSDLTRADIGLNRLFRH